MAQPYSKPPITEAVVEFRFAEPLQIDKVDLAAKRLGRKYARVVPHKDVRVAVDLDRDAVELKSTADGFKLFSKDGADVLLIRPLGMIQSRLAPYCGWEGLREKTETSWRAFSRLTGRKKVQRLGLRYINRIDIPAAQDAPVPIEEYLRVYAQLPPMSLSVDHFTMQIQARLPSELVVTLNVGTAPPALVDHYAVLLDMDVGCENLDQADDSALWTKLGEMREAKNQMFENLITDKTRALFV